MGSGGDEDAYAAVLFAIERGPILIAELEAAAASPKRDAALRLLREQLGVAIRRLNELDSNSHRN